MGRRKIEIQAIQRKNGLFKKAYELGVLCSVDVAVIIFDERPGHNRKLFEYSSCPVQDIIQRHLRHDGDTDARGVEDFSSGPLYARGDPDGYDDDEINEDDAALLASIKSGSSKRRGDGTLKSSPDYPSEQIEEGLHHPITPPVVIEISPQPPTTYPYLNQYPPTPPSIPTSSGRPTHKRPRLSILPTNPGAGYYSQSSSSEHPSPTFPPLVDLGLGNGYPPPYRHPEASPLTASTQYHSPQEHQHQHHNGTIAQQRHQHHHHHHQHQHHHQRQHQPYNTPQYTPLFPLRQVRTPPPAPADLLLGVEAPKDDAAPRTNGSQHGAPVPSSWGNPTPSGGGSVTADLFAALLHARDAGRVDLPPTPLSASGPGPGQGPQGGRRASFLPSTLRAAGGARARGGSLSFGLDWPVHAPSTGAGGAGGAGGGVGSGRSRTSPGSVPDWLDFLSGSAGLQVPMSMSMSMAMLAEDLGGRGAGAGGGAGWDQGVGEMEMMVDGDGSGSSGSGDDGGLFGELEIKEEGV